MLVGTDPLCGNLSALPFVPLLQCSPLWLQSFPPAHPPSPPVKGRPSVWKLFLLHSSLPEVQVPSLFFCLYFFCFLLLYPGTWGISCLLGRLRSSASFQWVFCRSRSTCRCSSDIFVERKVITMSYSSAILKVSLFIETCPFFLGCPICCIYLFIVISLSLFFFCMSAVSVLIFISFISYFVYLGPLFFLLGEPGQGFVNFVNCFKEPAFGFIDFFFYFYLYFIYFLSDLYYFLPSADSRFCLPFSF